MLEPRRPCEHLGKLIAHLRGRRSITPRSLLGKALMDAVGQWPHLEPCFMEGRIEFDNNLTENSIRPIKLGHTNWSFIGGEESGWRSAVIYTFVDQVGVHGLDPFAYFEWVFDKLTTNSCATPLPRTCPVNTEHGNPEKPT